MHSPASCFDEHFLHLFSFIHRLSNLVFIFCAGYKKCVLIGHDWGGLIAWCFAIYYPEMLNRVIILNCPHPAVFSGECHFKPLDTSYLMITDWRPWGLAELMDFSSESQAKPIWFNFLSLLSRLSPPMSGREGHNNWQQHPSSGGWKWYQMEGSTRMIMFFF